MISIDPALLATAALALGTARANGAELCLTRAGAGLRRLLDEDPMQAALATVLGSSVLFYLAERVANPKISRFEDALVFCTTCISVGYSDIFARTSSGKAIASFLMTYGPALAAKILDPPRGERVAREEAERVDLVLAQRAVLDTLEAILHELRRPG